MIRPLFCFFIIFFTTSCQQTPKKEQHQVRWNSDDFKELSSQMFKSILKSHKIDFSKKKVYAFKNIRNDSHDHIDTQALKNRLMTMLIKSKKFTFTQNPHAQQDYFFHGKISSILKKTKISQDMYFNFNLTLVNRTTSIVIWSNDIQIRKIYERPFFSL